MAFDKKKFKAQIKKMRITQKQLAEMFDVDLRTISRWLDPKVKINADNVRKLCQAINSHPKDFDDDWEGSFDTKNVARVSAKVSGAAKNGYWLLKKRYGVTETQICEIAPTLFALFAASIYETKTSAEYRKSEAFKLLAAEYGYMSEDDAHHYYHPYHSDYDADVEMLLKKGAIFGDRSVDEKYDDPSFGLVNTNFFFKALEKSAEGSQLIKLSYAPTGECPSGVGVAYDVPLTNEITGGDVELNEAISFGAIKLFSSEFEGLNSTSEKLDWMKDKMQKWKKEIKAREKETEERMKEFYKKHPELKIKSRNERLQEFFEKRGHLKKNGN